MTARTEAGGGVEASGAVRPAGGLRYCPHLGRADDPDTIYLHPHDGHRCHAVMPSGALTVEAQAEVCYAAFEACPRYQAYSAAGGVVAVPPGGVQTLDPLVARIDDPRPDAAAASGAAARAGAPGMAGAVRTGAPLDTAAANGDASPGTHAEGGPIPPDDGEARARSWAGRRTLEDWLALGGLVFVGLAVAYGALGAPRRDEAAREAQAPLPPREAALLAALDATLTPTPPPLPTSSPRPTRDSDVLPAATVPPPPAPEGGLVAALAPVERGVGTFAQIARVPAFGQRSLEVGWFDGEAMLGGLLIPLTRLPAGAALASAQLELAGLSDDNLGTDGAWTVEMLAPAAAQGWSDLTYDGLESAEAAGPSWTLPAAELVAGRVNVLTLDDAARQALAARLPEGRVAFRIRGPAAAPEDQDDLFVWDTGFGGGFGTRPVLRVGFVPPPPTPGPAPDEPTALPLIVWLGAPTPAPTATALPASLPASLAGRILFLSDRFGDTRLMVYDPAADRVGQVTQGWTYAAARAADTSAAGARVRVADVPCGDGGATIEDADGRPAPNPDPARRCAQLVVAGGEGQPAGMEREVTEPGWVHYDPALAPGGQWLAYVSQVTGTDEIFRVRTDGSGNQRLTENAWAWDKHPSISPDGARIVFWSNRDGRKQLWVMNADGSGQAPLAPSTFNDWDPVWVK